MEWPEKMGAFAPRNMWNVKIEIDGDSRRITVSSEDEEKVSRLSNLK